MGNYFLAIQVPQMHSASLARFAPEASGSIWPMAPALMHITLRFLGQRLEMDQAALTRALDGIQCSPFEVILGGVGTFGGERRGVLWAGVKSPGLLALHQQLVAALATVGVVPEERAYQAHVTLANYPMARDAVRRAFLAQTLPEHRFQAEAFSLYQSQRVAGISRHVDLHRVVLR